MSPVSQTLAKELQSLHQVKVEPYGDLESPGQELTLQLRFPVGFVAKCNRKPAGRADDDYAEESGMSSCEILFKVVVW